MVPGPELMCVLKFLGSHLLSSRELSNSSLAKLGQLTSGHKAINTALILHPRVVLPENLHYKTERCFSKINCRRCRG